MAWHPATIVRVLAPVALLACGGGHKQPTAPKPASETDPSAMAAAPETEEDREKKRHTDAIAIVPEGSSCLPAELRNPTAPRLELGVIRNDTPDGVRNDAVVCAIDQDRTRLLGSVACWAIDVHTGGLTYQKPAPLPGRGMSVMFDDRCARGYCLPKDAKVPTDPVAFMAWNLDSTKVAVLAGDNVHIFDAQSKAHESTFSIRGDKGVTSEPAAIDWNGDALFVEASDGTTSPVFVFKPDGTAVGAIEALGGKDKAPLSTRNGSFVLLDKDHVAVSEQGMSTLTSYETETGKRGKLVRKLPAGPCKKDELDATWHDPAATASPKCKDYIAKNFSQLIGADAIAGSKNLLVLLRGPRLGELAVVDPKTLAEKKTIKMPWCDAAGGGGAGAGADKASDKPAATATKKAKTDDPDAGGQ